MKKAFALIMAIAMVASMAAVSFAATGIDVEKQGNAGFVAVNPSAFYLYKNKAFVPHNGDEIPYGETIYVGLKSADWADIKDSDAVSGMKVSAKWTEGAEYVESVEIVKKGGIYVLAINTTGSNMDEKSVSGTISLGGKTIVKTVVDGEIEKDKESVDVDFDVDFTLYYGLATDLTVVSDGTEAIYNYEGVDEEEYEILVGDDITVETYMKNTKKVLFSYNDDENEELLDAYVDANLDFYNCSMTFRRSATVTLAAEEGSYLYEVVDGELVEVDAEYDEWEEAFVWKTRSLGNYVVSDVELEVAEEVVATNPSTGAAA